MTNNDCGNIMGNNVNKGRKTLFASFTQKGEYNAKLNQL